MSDGAATIFFVVLVVIVLAGVSRKKQRRGGGIIIIGPAPRPEPRGGSILGFIFLCGGIYIAYKMFYAR